MRNRIEITSLFSNREEFVDISRQNETKSRAGGGRGGESARSGSWTKAFEAFPPPPSSSSPPPWLASAGRRIMRAKQKDNSPIRGRKSGRNGSKKLLFKNVFTVWPGVRPRRSRRSAVGKLAVYPRFQRVCLSLLPPPPPPLRRFISRRRNRRRRARATGFCSNSSPYSSSSCPPSPSPLPPCPCPQRVRVCKHTGWGGVGGACAGEGSPRESVFPGSLFKTFSAPLRLRMEEGREGRGEGRGELQRKPLAEELLRPLRSNSIVVDWTGSLELEGCLFLGFFSFSCFFFFYYFFASFFFFPPQRGRICRADLLRGSR